MSPASYIFFPGGIPGKEIEIPVFKGNTGDFLVKKEKKENGWEKYLKRLIFREIKGMI